MDKLKWAVVGVGKNTATKGGATAIAYAHAEALKRNGSDFELVAGCARHQDSLSAFAAEYPCRTYVDMAELYAKEKPDGVTVSTYAPDREAHVLMAIEAGVKNILIEKPLALTMDAADRIKATADKAGARLFVNFQRRYLKPFVLAKEAVTSGRLGTVVSVDLAQPCANALDFGPHFINTALYLLGEPKPVSALAVTEGAGTVPWHGTFVEKRLSGVVFLDGGVRLDYTALPENSWQAPAIRVNGSRGFCEIWTDKVAGMKSVLRIVTPDGEENPELDENFHHGDVDHYVPFERCYADLAQAIRSGAPTRVDFAPGYETQKILLGLYESAKQAALFAF